MTTGSDTSARDDAGQDRIWSYFQNVARHQFAGSHPRQDYLATRVRRFAAGRQIDVLNIGIGDGYLELRLRALGCRVAALDPDAAAVARLAAARIDARVGYIEAIPFDDASFDCVIASEVIEHLDEAERRDGLLEIARGLRPGGLFIGTVPFREDLDAGATVCPHCGGVFHRWGHQASFDVGAVAAMLPHGLTLREARPKAFVPVRGRGAFGMLKSLVRRTLARLGEPIAQPTLFFVAERTRMQ